MKAVAGKIWFLWSVLLCTLMTYSFISVASGYEFDMESAVGRAVSLFNLDRDGPLLSFVGVDSPGNLSLIAYATEFFAFSIIPVIVVSFVPSIITGEWRGVHSRSAPAATPASAALRAHRARALSAPRAAFVVFIVFLSSSAWIFARIHFQSSGVCQNSLRTGVPRDGDRRVASRLCIDDMVRGDFLLPRPRTKGCITPFPVLRRPDSQEKAATTMINWDLR